MVRSRPSICDTSTPPPDAVTNFVTTDPQAVLWFVVTGALFGDVVVADFLTPQGSVYSAGTTNWDPLSGAGTYCFTSRSLLISGTDAATQIGRWTARVKVNGTMYASVPFNILANPCTYSLSPTSQTAATGGGTGSVGITVVGSGCPAWTASSNVSWITVQSGASGYSSGTVTYSVAPNPNASSRTGTVTIGGKTFTVTQTGSCFYSLNPASRSLGSDSGTGTVSVSAAPGCAWMAASNADWITVLSGASGSGGGAVSYSVAANPTTTSRTGTLTIATQTFTVVQAGLPCTCWLNPTSQSLGSGGGGGAANVNTTSGCAWTAASNADWITVQSGASGSGSGTVSYYAAANPNTTSRTGTLTIAGQTFTVVEAAALPPPPRPAIRPGGVTSASGFGGMAAITAGTWIEILGSNLSITTRTWAGSDFNGQVAPTSLDGVTVTVNSRMAFISYISPVQVNALVPSDIGTGTMQIVVNNGNLASDPYTITANAAEPGLLAPPAFLVNGRQYVAALLPDSQFPLPVGSIPGAASRPARPGEILVIYGVGFGAVNPSIPAGTIVSSPNSLAGPLQMTIGGAPALISFAGLAPGFVGLYQINVIVPNVPDNDAARLTFTLNGVPELSTLYLAVRQGAN